MKCEHSKVISQWINEYVDDWGTTVDGHWEYYTDSTIEDIDLHRYRCTQCGEVMYYSGRAKEHYEEGKKFSWIKGLE